MLPYLNHISEDQDVTVRNEAVQILIDLCQMCDSQKCQDFLDIIEKVSSFIFFCCCCCFDQITDRNKTGSEPC